MVPYFSVFLAFQQNICHTGDNNLGCNPSFQASRSFLLLFPWQQLKLEKIDQHGRELPVEHRN
jgi:hypothetical protein